MNNRYNGYTNPHGRSDAWRDYKKDKKTTEKNYSLDQYEGDNSSATRMTSSSTVWTSGLEVTSNPALIVPEEVQDICIAIQEEVGSPEWGALFKGEWTDEGFKVYPEYVIPEQKVSRTHIDYEEDLKQYRDDGYVVNIHSHPFSGHGAGFSGTDDEHINHHFNAALLYAGKAERIVDGIVNVDVSNGLRLQISPDLQVKRDPSNLPNVDISKIEERSTQVRNHCSQNSSEGTGTDSDVTEWAKNQFQNEAIENEDVSVKTAVKVPEEELKEDSEFYEDLEGIEVVSEEDGEDSKTGEKTENGGESE